MRDFGVSVLDQYDIDVSGTQRVRGGVVVTTKDDIYLLKEMSISLERIDFLRKLYQSLEEGDVPVDVPKANKEGEYLAKAEDGTTYMLKRWFQGRECEIKKENEIVEGARILAKIHQNMRVPEETKEGKGTPDSLLTEYERHNRELRKVHSFVRKRSVKNTFEAEFLRGYEKMYAQAQHALDKMREERYVAVSEKAQKNHEVSHGDYNYHNIIITNQQVAVTGFERAHIEPQISDLYYYLRKILEKYRYSERIAYQLLKAYDSMIPLDQNQKDYLAVRLSYPEKFWKICNSYYHSNKAWIPGKNVEKLKISIAQADEKKRLLEQVFSFHF